MRSSSTDRSRPLNASSQNRRVSLSPSRDMPPNLTLASVVRRAHVDADPRTGVVDVALRVPQRRLVLRLRRRRGVPRAYEDLVVAGLQLEHGAPVAPRPRAEILEQ